MWGILWGEQRRPKRKKCMTKKKKCSTKSKVQVWKLDRHTRAVYDDSIGTLVLVDNQDVPVHGLEGKGAIRKLYVRLSGLYKD